MKSDDADDPALLAGVRRRQTQLRRWLHEGDPSLMHQLASVGVLGWIIVVPMLGGLALGRWLDRTFASGVLWSGGLLVVGLALGCWSAWRWMHQR